MTSLKNKIIGTVCYPVGIALSGEEGKYSGHCEPVVEMSRQSLALRLRFRMEGERPREPFPLPDEHAACLCRSRLSAGGSSLEGRPPPAAPACRGEVFKRRWKRFRRGGCRPGAKRKSRDLVLMVAFLTLLFSACVSCADNDSSTPVASASSGNKSRFRDHGVPVPVAECRGLYPVRDGDGANLLIATSLDESPRGWILVTDIDKGETEQVFCPEGVPNSPPYQSIMGSNGKLYTSQGGIFLEFDPDSRQWTFQGRAVGARAILSMAEGPDGTIWMGDVYRAGLHSFNPETRELKSYGRMDDRETYLQYLGFDDKGWVYCGIGTARANLVAFNPEKGERRQLVPDDKRATNIGKVWRGIDGRLYGSVELKDGNSYFILSDGKGTPVERNKTSREPPAKAGGKPVFPDGRIVSSYDFASRRMEIFDPSTLQCRIMDFDYDTTGAAIRPQAMTAGPDGKLYLNSGHPAFFAFYDPETDTIHRFPDRHAQQSLAVQGKYIVGGRYTGGKLKLFDTTRPWCKVPPPPEIIDGFDAKELAEKASTTNGVVAHMGARDTLAFRTKDTDGQVDFTMDVATNGAYNLLVATESIPGHPQVQLLVDGGKLGKPVSITGQSRDYIEPGPILTVGPTNIASGVHTVSVRVVKSSGSNAVVLVKSLRLTSLDPAEAITQPPSELNPFRAIPSSRPNINRPIVSFGHPDGKHVMIAGMPCYGRTGGGLSIYNIETREITKLSHEDLIPYHSIVALVALTNGNLMGSTTVSGTHGGHAVEKNACVFEFDWKKKKVAWKYVPVEGVRTLKLRKIGADGKLYCTGFKSCLLGRGLTFFVLDPRRKEIVFEKSLATFGGGGKMLDLPDGSIYVMTSRAILEFNPETYEFTKIADAPTPVGACAVLGDRIYFASGSHLWSYGI